MPKKRARSQKAPPSAEELEEYHSTSSESGSPEPAPEPAPEPEPAPPRTKQRVWPIGNNARLEVSTFKGQVRIDVRKTYRDAATGEQRPTKKGINMSVVEFDALSELLTDSTGVYDAVDAERETLGQK